MLDPRRPKQKSGRGKDRDRDRDIETGEMGTPRMERGKMRLGWAEESLQALLSRPASSPALLCLFSAAFPPACSASGVMTHDGRHKWGIGCLLLWGTVSAPQMQQ